jgi:hypothetical protein
MRVFWYISRDKLETLDQGPGFLDRLTGKVRVGVLVADIEAGIQSADVPNLVTILGKVEKRLQRDQTVVPVEQIQLREGNTALFAYEGPSARFAENEAFWVAGVSGNTGILLVGSPTNAVGAKLTEHITVMSPSVDPLGAVMMLYDQFVDPDDQEILKQRPSIEDFREAKYAGKEIPFYWADEHNLSEVGYAWRAILAKGLWGTRSKGLGTFPVTRGIAVYAGIQERSSPSRSSGFPPGDTALSEVKRIVVGTPLFVEQVTAARRRWLRGRMADDGPGRDEGGSLR